MTRMTDFEICFLACWLLLLILVAYAWFTREQRVPGRHRATAPEAGHLYPPLSEFPGFPELGELARQASPDRERLASTGELRKLAYDGDMETINKEVAHWRELMDGDDFTTAA